MTQLAWTSCSGSAIANGGYLQIHFEAFAQANVAVVFGRLGSYGEGPWSTGMLSVTMTKIYGIERTR